MNDTSSETYQIKKNNFSKFFIIIPILVVILIIVLLIFIINRPSPKSTVVSFINAMQDANFDKLITYIDFDSMIAFSTTSGNIDDLNIALEHLPNLSEEERGNYNESINYTKRYIHAVLDEVANDKTIFNITNVEVSNIESNPNLNKVIAYLDIEKNGDKKNEIITFYTIKINNHYYIIDFDGEIYF